MVVRGRIGLNTCWGPDVDIEVMVVLDAFGKTGWSGSLVSEWYAFDVNTTDASVIGLKDVVGLSSNVKMFVLFDRERFVGDPHATSPSGGNFDESTVAPVIGVVRCATLRARTTNGKRAVGRFIQC